MPTTLLQDNPQTLFLHAEDNTGSVAEADLSGIITVPGGQQWRVTDFTVSGLIATQIFLVISINAGGAFSRLHEIDLAAAGSFSQSLNVPIPVNGALTNGVEQIQLKFRYSQAGGAGRCAASLSISKYNPR